MKFMKIVLSIIICFTFVFTVFYFNSSAISITDSDFVYDANDRTGTAIITKYKGNEQEVIIPDTIEEYNVVGINNFVFAHKHSIEKVVIGENIKTIGYGAFANCSLLKEIEISNLNTEYLSANNIIFNKDKTKIICYPSGKTEQKYVIPNTVKELESYSFSYALNLKEITLSNEMTIIPNDAFLSCSKLETVIIPESVTEIQDRAFDECVSLKQVYYNGYENQWDNINMTYNDSKILDNVVVCKDADKNFDIKLTDKDIQLFYSSKVPFELKVSDKTVIKVDGTPKENTSGLYEVTAKITPLKSGTTTISAVAENGFVLCNFNYTVAKCTHPSFHFTKTEKAATCTENGIEIYTCDYCDFTETRTVKAIDHSLGEWEVEVKATKDKEGLEVRICNNYNCDYKEERIIPKLPTTTEPDNSTGNTSTKFVLGDVDSNKKVNATDARKVLRYVAGLEQLNSNQLKAANVDGNKSVTATDARRILRHVAGLETL
ncbi:MAG: leucine-rich repeat protein [Clostridia bacterium]|nr:leucine-rich repeat protein [Clostridia bacterium]